MDDAMLLPASDSSLAWVYEGATPAMTPDDAATAIRAATIGWTRDDHLQMGALQHHLAVALCDDPERQAVCSAAAFMHVAAAGMDPGSLLGKSLDPKLLRPKLGTKPQRIGTTRSGKPIYNMFTHPAHASFKTADHVDHIKAMEAHSKGEKMNKAGGEGSRGGKVIGHTSRGAPIYASGHASYKNVLKNDAKETTHVMAAHPNFDGAGHMDASRAHMFSQVHKTGSEKEEAHNRKAKHLEIAHLHAAHQLGVIHKDVHGNGYVMDSHHGPYGNLSSKKSHAENGKTLYKEFGQTAAPRFHEDAARAHAERAADTIGLKREGHKVASGAHAWVAKHLRSKQKSMSKSGEGSRGGKVIGHTNGKPIYAATTDRHAGMQTHPKGMGQHVIEKNPTFTATDHLSAAAHHERVAEKINSKPYDGSRHSDVSFGKYARNVDTAKAHREAAEIVQSRPPVGSLSVKTSPGIRVAASSKTKTLKHSFSGTRPGVVMHKSEAVSILENFLAKSNNIIGKTSSGFKVRHPSHSDYQTGGTHPKFRFQGLTKKDHEEAAAVHEASPYKGSHNAMMVHRVFASGHVGKLAKSGEGSRGGKVVGHTRAGKAIYSTNSYKDLHSKSALHNASDSHSLLMENRDKVLAKNPKWTAADHNDASAHHSDHTSDHGSADGHHDGPTHYVAQNAHYLAARHLEAKAKKSMSKSGEGSRGGKVIGHTKSGKPVYAGAKSHSSHYSKFSSTDHADAASLYSAGHSAGVKKMIARGLPLADVKKQHKTNLKMADLAISHSKAAESAHDAKKSMSKSGEGSRGGKVIGHLKNGKAIYASAAKDHANFSAHDHYEAAQGHYMTHLHHSFERDQAASAGMGEAAKRHKMAAQKHFKASSDHADHAVRLDPSIDTSHDTGHVNKPYAERPKTAKKSMSKSGEGSRGGKIIGHTRSGKPIYGAGGRHMGIKTVNARGDSGNFKSNLGKNTHSVEQSHKDYSKQDHLDAAAHLHSVAKEHKGGYGEGFFNSVASAHKHAARKKAEKSMSKSDIIGFPVDLGDMQGSPIDGSYVDSMGGSHDLFMQQAELANCPTMWAPIATVPEN